MKKNILFLVIGFILASGIGAFAYSYTAKQVGFTPSDKSWKVKTVDEALTDLRENGTEDKICTLKSGNALEIGSMYECNPSLDGTTKYNFYVLKTEGNFVKLIMQRNISDTVGSTRTMNWQTAMDFFRDGAGKSLNWKTAVDLPDAQTIADVVGNTGWKTAEKDYNGWFCFGTGYTQACASNSGALKNDSQTQKYKWLFNYTRECENSGCDSETSLDSNYAYGYWTGDMVSKQLDTTARAWNVLRGGSLYSDDVSDATTRGVRPVITISKSNIS